MLEHPRERGGEEGEVVKLNIPERGGEEGEVVKG